MRAEAEAPTPGQSLMGSPMDFARFAQLFRRGCLGSTKVEPTQEVLEKKHLRTLALIQAGELATVRKQDGYAYVSGRNWSIDQTQAAGRANRRSNAVDSVNQTIAERDGQIDLFLQAMDLVEHTFIGRYAMVEGAEILRRLIGGEELAELCKEFAINADALCQRVCRVRKEVLASGLVQMSELDLLFGQKGKFRPASAYEAGTDKLRNLTPVGCVLHLRKD